MEDLIPLFAIGGAFAIPIVSIIMEHRRRKLQYEERRLMIEKGMQVPPVPLRGESRTSTQQRRERSLYSGIIFTGLGLGLGLASWLLGYVLPVTFIPPQVSGPMAVGASVVGFLGVANLVYYAITRRAAIE
jgi:Domain of unknown function (DUF6249)